MPARTAGLTPLLMLKPKKSDTTPAPNAELANQAASPAAPAAHHGTPAPETATPGGSPNGETVEFRNNAAIDKGINDYMAANPEDVKFFTDLVAKNPDRAVRFHFKEKWQRHERDTKEAARQMPQAQALYDRMTPDSKARVDERLEGVNSYSHTKEFVGAVFGEMNRSSMAANRRALRTPFAPKASSPAAETAAPAPAAPKMAVG